MVMLSIKEEVFGANCTNFLDVPIDSYHVTLAELIKSKVAAKIWAVNEDMNQNIRLTSKFQSEKQHQLNKDLVEKREKKRWESLKIDVEKAAYEALVAFQRNAFFVLVDGAQKTNLEENLQLSDHSQVHFIRLMPLVGG